MTYTRPEGKSGGHGVGWSEIPRYTFKVPQGWQESPVSIADLGGTEVKHGGCTSDCPMAPYHILWTPMSSPSRPQKLPSWDGTMEGQPMQQLSDSQMGCF